MQRSGNVEKSTLPILFREYPELEKKLAWISLGRFPTPIQRLRRLGGGNLWIKRDDVSSPVYGGNKIRKLEFILGSAKRKKTDHVITFGGIGTNHGLATAIFCSSLNIACTLLLFWQPVNRFVRQNLLLFQKYNARLKYKKTLWRTVLAYYVGQRLRYPTAHFVFAGGSTIRGTIGYVNAAYELKEHVQHGEIPEPATIICPLGSGGTVSGLALGMQLAGLNTAVIGVRVSASHLGFFQACTAGTIKTLMNATYRYLRKASRAVPDIAVRPPQILHDYFGDGYGFPTAAGAHAYRIARQMEAIMLEPTYTAKTFAAVLDYCGESQRHVGPVLYWHTYNSVDLSEQAACVDHRRLPEPLRKLMEQKTNAGTF